MGYARPCLIQPALSGLARSVTQLPISTMVSLEPEHVLDPSYPQCDVQYVAVPDRSADQLSCLPTHVNYSLSAKIDIYLQYIITGAHGNFTSYRFTRNGGRGTYVGSIEYGGRGIWSGTMQHPVVDGSLYVELMTRNCQATQFVGRFGPFPGTAPLQMLSSITPAWTGETDNPQPFNLGTAWFVQDDWGGESISPLCPFTFAPEYYRGIPTSYQVIGGDIWDDVVTTGSWATLEHSPACVDEFGRSINWQQRVAHQDTLRTLRTFPSANISVRQWHNPNTDCRLMTPGEKSYVLFGSDESGLSSYVRVAWSVAHERPGFETGKNEWLVPGSLAVGDDGGLDWFSVVTLYQSTAGVYPQPVPSTGWEDYLPAAITVAPLLA